MTVRPWMKVDRSELKQEVRLLCEEGQGLLVVRGDDSSGREVMAEVVEDAFEWFGFSPNRVLPSPGRADTVRDLLGRAWRNIEPEGDLNAIRRSVGNARFMTPSEIITGIEECVSASRDRVGFVFDMIDPDGPVSRQQFGDFVLLARLTSSPVVAFSRTESRSIAPPTAAVFELGSMPISDIRTSLMTDHAYGAASVEQRQALISRVEELSHDGETVLAVDAYDVLEMGLAEAEGHD